MENIPLGKPTTYSSYYDKTLLFPIPRINQRSKLNIHNKLPFTGADHWTAYEISYLNNKGKPCVVIGEFIIPTDSENIVESKSLKLYLGSFADTKFSSLDEIKQVITQDLSELLGTIVQVNLYKMDEISPYSSIKTLPGFLLDDYDIECDVYQLDASFLKTHDEYVSEELRSDLLKSNCLITHQPDTASIYIKYSGKKIDHQNLLKYIISYRNHNDFHEHCIEQIFCDILNYCKPDKLTIYARYNRRGGIDINPYRTNDSEAKNLIRRLVRQ